MWFLYWPLTFCSLLHAAKKMWSASATNVLPPWNAVYLYFSRIFGKFRGHFNSFSVNIPSQFSNFCRNPPSWISLYHPVDVTCKGWNILFGEAGKAGLDHFLELDFFRLVFVQDFKFTFSWCSFFLYSLLSAGIFLVVAHSHSQKIIRGLDDVF